MCVSTERLKMTWFSPKILRFTESLELDYERLEMTCFPPTILNCPESLGCPDLYATGQILVAGNGNSPLPVQLEQAIAACTDGESSEPGIDCPST